MTIDELARMHLLLAEGMPANWVAEDLGRHYDNIKDYAAGRGDHAHAVSEWKQVWSGIKNRPELASLHEQFMPREGRVYDLNHAETPHDEPRGSGVGETPAGRRDAVRAGGGGDQPGRPTRG